jgi:hypothetical protein
MARPWLSILPAAPARPRLGAANGHLAQAAAVLTAAFLTFVPGVSMAQPPTTWPDAKELAAKHASLVLGGFDSSSHRTRYTRQHTVIVPGTLTTIERFQRRPSDFIQRITGSDGSTVDSGYVGGTAWELHNGRARIVTGAEAQALELLAEFFYGVLGPPAQPLALPNAKTLGEATFAGQAVFAVSPAATLAVAVSAGMPILYFSKETGLYAGTTVGGENQSWFVSTILQDYKRLGGLLVATQLTTTSRTGSVTFKQVVITDEIHWDEVAGDEFTLPDAVRRLLKP